MEPRRARRPAFVPPSGRKQPRTSAITGKRPNCQTAAHTMFPQVKRLVTTAPDSAYKAGIAGSSPAAPTSIDVLRGNFLCGPPPESLTMAPCPTRVARVPNQVTPGREAHSFVIR